MHMTQRRKVFVFCRGLLRLDEMKGEVLVINVVCVCVCVYSGCVFYVCCPIANPSQGRRNTASASVAQRVFFDLSTAASAEGARGGSGGGGASGRVPSRIDF